MRSAFDGPRLARRVLDALLVAEVATVVLAIVLVRLVPLTGRQTLIIEGGSMEPTVPLGAAVIVEPIAASSLHSGDIVSVRLPSGVVFTHRVNRVIDRSGETWLETKGDANPSPDPALVPASWTVGRVLVSLPYAGYLLRLLSIPAGVLLMLCLGGTLLAAIWLVQTYQDESLASQRRRHLRVTSLQPASIPRDAELPEPVR